MEGRSLGCRGPAFTSEKKPRSGRARRRSPGARSVATKLRRRARRRRRARGKSGGSANESGCQTRLLQGCADREVLEQQTTAPGLEELWEKEKK